MHEQQYSFIYLLINKDLWEDILLGTWEITMNKKVFTEFIIYCGRQIKICFQVVMSAMKQKKEQRDWELLFI